MTPFCSCCPFAWWLVSTSRSCAHYRRGWKDRDDDVGDGCTSRERLVAVDTPDVLSSSHQRDPVRPSAETSNFGVHLISDTATTTYTYLIAIAAGNVRYKAFDKVVGREWSSGIWAEPEFIEAAHWEFREDTTKCAFIY